MAALRKEINEEIAKGNESKAPSLADTQKEPVAPFRIIDEVRECRELFRKLEDTLSHSWEAMYREAEIYYRQNGHLRVPKYYRTPEGARLGNWIETQRRVKRGALYGDLTEEKIRRLEQIGMNWTTRSETSLEEGLSHAKAYKEQFGNLNVTSRYISPDGYRLGKWISAARDKYTAILNSKRNIDPFDIPKLKALDELGMIWNRTDESLQRGLRAAKEYAERNGNLEVSFTYVTEDGFALGKWLESQRTWMKNNKATGRAKQRYAQLSALGMRWNTKASCIWEANYQTAKAYYDVHHHLNPPCNYKMGRLNLGKWIARQRELFRKGKLNQEQIAKLESIHMNWISPALWNRYFALAEQYIRENGNPTILEDYVTPEGVLLGRWLHEQRKDEENGTLSPAQRQKLNALIADQTL